jgi:hypothetical protein
MNKISCQNSAPSSVNHDDWPDDFPEPISGEDLLRIDFGDIADDGKPIEACPACPDCGGELAEPYEERRRKIVHPACTCDPYFVPPWVAEQKSRMEYLREFDRILGYRKTEEEKEEDGSIQTGEGLSAFVFGNETLTNIALEIQRCCRVPEELAVVGILASLSCALGKGLNIEYKLNATTPLGLYILGFMKSGGGKSASMDRSMRPVSWKQAELRARWEQDSALTKANLEANESRIGALKKEASKILSSEKASELAKLIAEKDKLQKELKPPSLMMEDFTLEAMRNVMSINECKSR